MKHKKLFDKHIIYFKLLDELGKGIMLKPHLEQYIIKLCNYSSSNFNKIIKELSDAKLINVERTKSASIVVLTCPSLAILRGKESSKQVSISSIRTNANLQKSMITNEYIITNYLTPYATYNELIGELKRGNLTNKQGDNVGVAEHILKRSEGGFIGDMQKELEYLKAARHNRTAQLKNNNLDKVVADKKDCSINNLQARHMYITSPEADLEIAYMEIAKPITYEKFKTDMKILGDCTEFIQTDSITIDVVVESNRARAVESIVREWERKQTNRSTKITLNTLTINIIPLDIKDKYLKGVNISL